MLQPKEFHPRFPILLEEELSEDSLISKLLRWLTASVILGKLSWKSNGLNLSYQKRSNLESLHSLLEYIHKTREEDSRNGSGSGEILAAAIFYLQQLLGMNCRVLPSVVSALCLLILSDASYIAGSGLNSMLDCGNPMASLLSIIHCPAEANPAWRWSFYQPWKDLSLELTDLEKLDELHACQTLLVIISNVLGERSLDLHVLSHQDVENSGVFKWERSILEIGP